MNGPTAPDPSGDAIPARPPTAGRSENVRPHRHDSSTPTRTELDFPAADERPSTLSDPAPTDEEQRLWQGRAPSPGPASSRHPGGARAPRDPGADARDAPIRLLPADFVPLTPEQRAEAVRALTEMILSWMRRTGRAAKPDTETDSDLNRAA